MRARSTHAEPILVPTTKPTKPWIMGTIQRSAPASRNAAVAAKFHTISGWHTFHETDRLALASPACG